MQLQDDARAERVARFFEHHLRHTKGRWGGRPFLLEDFQREILTAIFGTVDENGRRWYREALIGLARKNGKALDVATPILTTNRGWVSMGEIIDGDYVLHPSGQPTRVIATSQIMQDHDCYRVELSDGREVVADAGHLWTVRDRHRKREVTVDTATLAATLRIGNRLTHREHRYSVPVPATIQMPQAELPIDPYILGAWLGDGSSTKAEITTADPEILAAFAEHYTPSYTYAKGKAAVIGMRGGLLTALKDLGVLRNKHVPEPYMIASAEQRLGLLRGLMDTDGCVVGRGRQTRVEFTSTNLRLGEAVLFLARSLGWKATIITGRATLYGKDCGPKYRVTWAAHRHRSPFALERKTARLGDAPIDRARSSSIQVVAVERVSTRPVRCLQVEADDGLFLAGRDLVPTHNSELAAGIALYMLLADGEYAPEVYSVAGDRKQASLVFNTAADMVNASPMLRAACRVFRGGKVIEVRENNGIYRALSADADLQHGLNPSCAIIDEYHVHRNAEQYEAMRTGMAARENPLTVTISTAGPAQRGALWELLRRGQSGDDERMLTYWRGAQDGDDLASQDVWRAANPASWVTMDFLQDQFRSLPLGVFARLHLNAWYNGADEGWVTRDQIDACVGEPQLADDLPVVIAVDAASRRDTTAVMAVQRDEAGRFHRRCWHFSSDYVMGYLDYGVVEALIREICSTFQVTRCAFDPFQMVRTAQILASEGVPVETFPQNDSRMVPASQLLYELIVEGRLVLDACPTCQEQILAAGVVETARGWRLHKLKSAGPIDAAVALAMGVQLAEWEHALAGGPRVLVL